MTRIRIPPIALHEGQRRVLETPARFKIIAAGRRFGKTLLAVEWLALAEGGAIDGASVGFFAPTYKLLMETWNDFERTLTPVKKRSNKTEMRIELITGGKIDCWTLEDKDAGRGRRYHRIVIDEAAHARYFKDAWEQSINPTLTDYHGEAWFISTPNGMNYFYELFKRGGDPAYPEWASFRMPTSANPHIDPAELEHLKRTLPLLVYKQEIEAEFVDVAGAALIKREWLRYYDAAPECDVVTIGVDLAISKASTADYTCAVVMGRSAQGNVYVLDLWRSRATMMETVHMLQALIERWAPSVIAIESVAYQVAVAEIIERVATHATVQRIKPTADKIMRAQNFISRCEQGLVYLPRAATWLHDYEQELLAFPVGDHDDQVDASVYALAAMPMNTGFQVVWL
ncbi:MAG: hypothetical protein KatS3mg038_2523 [Candidatus Kapaibacterium sp.]|nr:MAG: hypothetical protein KatS3mg038_2523 [Candidatus Kapabacteria bacterium]